MIVTADVLTDTRAPAGMARRRGARERGRVVASRRPASSTPRRSRPRRSSSTGASRPRTSPATSCSRCARERSGRAHILAELGEVLVGAAPGRHVRRRDHRSSSRSGSPSRTSRRAPQYARSRRARGERCGHGGRVLIPPRRADPRGPRDASPGPRSAHAARPAERSRRRRPRSSSSSRTCSRSARSSCAAPATRCATPRAEELAQRRLHRERRQHGPGRRVGGARSWACRARSSFPTTRPRPSSRRSSGSAARW